MMAFSVLLLAAIWTLQSQMLPPYFRSARIRQTPNIAIEVENYIVRDQGMLSTQTSSAIATLLYNNNTCAFVYAHGQGYLKASALNYTIQGCTPPSDKDVQDYVASVDASSTYDTKRLYQELSENGSEEKIGYARSFTLTNNDGSASQQFYLITTSSLSIIPSTLNILRDQFLFVAIVVFSSSILVALFISYFLSNPIVKMKRHANELAGGNFAVRFDHGGFTEVNELADTLNYATQEMQRTDELRRDLIANVSHDIKTPLTMIRAYTEMIQDISGNNPVKRGEHLKVILNETNYLTNLVNDMLELSKVQSGTMSVNVQTFDLSQQIADILELFDVNESGVEIKVEMVPGAMVSGDSTKLAQVFHNFLNNAIKHCGEDKTVWVKVIDKKDTYRVEVTDQGSGIAKEDQPLIWDRYFKIDKNYQRETQGSGLGLSIVRGICDSMHIPYGVVSEKGKGSTFYYEVIKVK